MDHVVRRLAAALLAALLTCALLTAGPGPASASAHAAARTQPSVSVEFLDAGIINVPSNTRGGQYVEFLIHLSTKPAGVEVAYTPGDDGLTLTDPAPDEITPDDIYRDGTHGYRIDDVTELRVTPGLHTLTLDITPSGGGPTTVNAQVWGLGGAAPTRHDDLTGRSMFGEYDAGDESVAALGWERLDFVSPTLVSLTYRTSEKGPNAPAPATCRPGTYLCRHYVYDSTTHMLQIQGHRGLIAPGGSSFDNLAYHRLAVPARGARLRFSGVQTFDRGAGFGDFSVRLRSNGSYVRTGESTTSDKHTEKGRYVVGRHGLITLTSTRGKVLRTSLALVATAAGVPASKADGILLGGMWFHPRR